MNKMNEYFKNADKCWLAAGAGLALIAVGIVGWYTYGLLQPSSSTKHDRTEKVKSANKASKTSPDMAWITGVSSSSTMVLVPNAASSSSSSASANSGSASSDQATSANDNSSSANSDGNSLTNASSAAKSDATETVTNPTTKKTMTITYATDGSTTAVCNLAKQLAKNKIAYVSGGSSLDGLDQVGMVNYVYGKTANLSLGNSLALITLKPVTYSSGGLLKSQSI